MPFLIYRRQASGADLIYDQPRLVKLGGTSGPIARFVQTLKGDKAESGWELDAAALAQLAGVSDDDGKCAVLFEVASVKSDGVCLYELKQLCGVARDRRTHLSLDFEVLVDEVVDVPPDDFRHAFTIPGAKPKKRLREILQLSGGPDGGDWKWETPAMNLGATLVGPAISS